MQLEADREQPRASPAPRQLVTDWTVCKISLLAFLLLLFLAQLALGYAGVVTGGGIERYIREHADFRAVLTGGLTIRDGMGHLLYDEATERTVQRRILAPYFFDNPAAVLPNSHPPFESLFVAPLMGLPYAVSFGLWTALEVAALLAALCLLARAAPVNSPTRWLLLAGALAYHPFHLVLWTGQSSPLILLGFCGLYAALQRRQAWWAGAGLALILLKPQLAVAVVLILILHRQWRTLVAAAGIWAAATVMVMPIIGADWPLRYARYLAGSASWGAEHFEYIPGMYNWRGFAQNLLAERLPELINPLTMLLTIVTLGLLTWASWQTRTASPRVTQPISDTVWALTGIATVLIPQHLYPHDLSLLIFPGWLIVAAVASGRWSGSMARGWLALVAVGFALPLLIFVFASRTAQAVPPSVIYLTIVLGALTWTIAHDKRSPATANV